jgi:hypothetical protein
MKRLPGPYAHLRRRDALPVGLSFIGPGAATAVALLSMNPPTTLAFVIGVIATVAPGLFTVDSLARTHQADDASEREKRRGLARLLLGEVFATAAQLVSTVPGKTGVMLFVPDNAGDLRVMFAHNKEGKPDSELVLTPPAGCTGHAWWSEKQTWADLSQVTDDDLAQTWKLTSTQIRLTTHIKAIVSTPVWSSATPKRKLGVLSVDCEEPMTVCGMADRARLDQTLAAATSTAYILELADLP